MCKDRRAFFKSLQAEASELRKGYDGYRAAFECLQAEASELRKNPDGYQGAYEDCCAQLAAVRDERDRVLRSLEKLRIGKVPLRPGLHGRQLCFMHIGKTAGTSVQQALFEAMQGTAIFHDSLPNFDSVSAVELAINDLVAGHFMLQHVAKLRPDRFLMAFLRDPVERVISNYHFLRSGSPVSHFSKGAIDAAGVLTLREFLLCNDPAVRMITENFQAKR
jgi:sulfotransferase famil protein